MHTQGAISARSRVHESSIVECNVFVTARFRCWPREIIVVIMESLFMYISIRSN